MRRILACDAPRLASALLLVLVACGPGVRGGGDDDDDDGDRVDSGWPDDDGDGGPQVTEQCKKMDLVFVIDDSGSMELEQRNLGDNFPTFANLLNSYTISTGEMLDYRAAITTTGVTASYTQTINAPPLPPVSVPGSQTGRNGRFVQACNMQRAWLERTDPNMAQTFACAANVGINGPGLEMQLRAAELAIQPTTNPGFLRDDALLGIVILTDEDDCSFRTSSGIVINGLEGCTTAPGIPAASEFVTAIDQIKGERGRWAAAVIAGQTSCTSDFGDAVEGVRLKQFAQAAGSNVVFGDICQGSLTGALQQALDTFQAACENFPPID
ncbi:MAG TPA: hypothetical protein VM734_15935 [Kofleriaceae bacterium]|jgi:hypothetical protein|nr:hypothetical protein [Kofleriaceae bacterium]